MRWEEGLIISCLVDSDICIDYLRGREYTKVLFRKWMERGLLSISAITHLEIYAGMRKGEESATADFLDNMVTVPVDESVAGSSGNIIRHLRAKGLTISPMDSIIAASALFANVPLVTNKVADYPVAHITGLPIVNGIGK
ncbi:MAG: PIN domain-containing protein [Dehalococcoidia bacterium]|nr:PIN domain-containing protein [Dehalococcoidia bacterium]MDD5495228.1 PIN domain-containing protein [Dehalococcoidia bacterium]